MRVQPPPPHASLVQWEHPRLLSDEMRVRVLREARAAGVTGKRTRLLTGPVGVRLPGGVRAEHAPVEERDNSPAPQAGESGFKPRSEHAAQGPMVYGLGSLPFK